MLSPLRRANDLSTLFSAHSALRPVPPLGWIYWHVRTWRHPHPAWLCSGCHL